MKRRSWKSVLLMAMTLLLGVTGAANSNRVRAQEHPEDKVEKITVEELQAKLAKNEKLVIIDVRGSDYDSSATKIKGAIRIPPAELAARLAEIPRDQEIVTYCACSTDGGSVKAALTLLNNGFKKARALKGGWNAWNAAHGAVEAK